MIVGFRRSDWCSLPNDWLGRETRRAVTLLNATARRVLRSNSAAPSVRSSLSSSKGCSGASPYQVGLASKAALHRTVASFGVVT
jgi:hypothetical protein